MALSKSEDEPSDSSRFVRIGGYLILIGILIGVTMGVYALFNPPLLLLFINISQYDATAFFLTVYLPAFITIIAIGYLFATTPKTMRLNSWRIGILCVLILLCFALSGLSVLNLLSVVGSFLVLVALLFAYAKPTFESLRDREACFLVQTGTILVSAGYILFLIMWSISAFLQTYSPGIYEATSAYPYVLLGIGALSVVVFLATPALGFSRWNVGLSGLFSLAISILSFVVMIQNQYAFFNPSVYQGIILVSIGAIITFCGAATYIRLFLSRALLSPSMEPILLYNGKHCPYCGKLWKKPKEDTCKACGRKLDLKNKPSFCPYCGRQILQDSRHCSYCRNDIRSLPIYVSLAKPETGGRISRVLEWIGLSLKELMAVVVATLAANFLSFIAYVRTEQIRIGYGYVNAGDMIQHYGFPFEWYQILLRLHHYTKSPRDYYYWIGIATYIDWVSLIVNLTIYFLMAYGIVYAIKRVRS
jgi:hypothetical protein